MGSMEWFYDGIQDKASELEKYLGSIKCCLLYTSDAADEL